MNGRCHRRNIADAQADLAKFNKAKRLDADGNVINDLHLNNCSASGNSAEALTKLGNHLIKIANTARTQEAYLNIGTIYGFKVQVKTVQTGSLEGVPQYDNNFFVTSNRLLYSYNGGKINRNSPKTSAQYMLNALLHLPEHITAWSEKVEENEGRIQQIASIIGKTWAKENDLKRLKSELKALDQKIAEDMKKKEQQPIKEAA